jgi:hypothetical protein
MRQWSIWGAEEGHDEVGTFVLSRALSVIVVTGAMGHVLRRAHRRDWHRGLGS